MESGGGVVQAPPVDSDGFEPSPPPFRDDELRVTASNSSRRAYLCATSPLIPRKVSEGYMDEDRTLYSVSENVILGVGNV